MKALTARLPGIPKMQLFTKITLTFLQHFFLSTVFYSFFFKFFKYFKMLYENKVDGIER